MITYTINHFAQWMQEYPSWTQLKAYLTSEAGGKLSIIESADGAEAIIRYDKKVSDMNMDHVRWSRSVVWDCIGNRPLSIATPKAAETTSDMMNSPINTEWQIQPFYEGVTMNIYKNAAGQTNIATRTKFGAAGNFYSQRSFAELYEEACAAKGKPDLGPYDFMCIIVQHPEHRVVGKTEAPTWIGLHVGTIAIDGTVTITETVQETESCDADKPLKDWFAEKTSTAGWDWQGVVIKDGTGNRWRLRSNVYRLVRSLRGETPREDERFFMLRSKGLIKSYLFYYPEDKQRYWEHEKWLRWQTEEIFKLYCAVFKERSKEFNETDRRYQPHLSAIHSLFVGQLKPAGRTVNMAVVREYMNGLPVPRLLFLRNYEKKHGLGHAHAHAQVSPTVIANTVSLNIASASGHIQASRRRRHTATANI